MNNFTINTSTCFNSHCSLYIAAMHYNENGGRGQAQRKDGEFLYKIRFPKFKHGHHVVAKVSKDPSFSKCYRFLVVSGMGIFHQKVETGFGFERKPFPTLSKHLLLV